jgi:hypothetical protein
MVNTIRVIVNTNLAETFQSIEVVPGRGDLGRPARLKAFPGGRYLLQDDSLKNLGPQKLRTQRVGKNLHVFLDGHVLADLIVEGYFDEANLIDVNQGVMGRGADGLMYSYVPSEPGVVGLGIDGGGVVSHFLNSVALPEAAWPLMAGATTGFSTATGLGLGYSFGVAAGTAAVAVAASGGGGGGGGGGASVTGAVVNNLILKC